MVDRLLVLSLTTMIFSQVILSIQIAVPMWMSTLRSGSLRRSTSSRRRAMN